MSIADFEPKLAVAKAAAPEAPAAARSGRVKYNQGMKWVRRAHLYAGLFLTPWVFLYGVTALLFNHPDLFSDQDVRAIRPADLAGTPLADLPGPSALAEQVVGAINAAQGEEGEGPTYRLVRPDEAEFSREYATTVVDGTTTHLIRLDLADRTGTIRSSTAAPRPESRPATPAPFAGAGRLALKTPPLDAAQASLPALLAKHGLKGETPAAAPAPAPGPDAARRPEGRGDRRGPGSRSEPNGAAGKGEAAQAAPRAVAQGGGRNAPPELTFLMEGEGKVWRVAYNLQAGTLSGRPDDAPASGVAPSTRRFLLRLHTAHGYSDGLDSRWAWALAVDAMGLSMIGWGVSGLLMWWQMKNVRRIGVVLLAISAVTATAGAIGMHGAISNAGGPEAARQPASPAEESPRRKAAGERDGERKGGRERPAAESPRA